MSQKRQPEEGEAGPGEGASPEEKRQKVPALKRVIVEAMKMNYIEKMLTSIEPLVRRIVKEEVELALANHLANMTRQCGEQVFPSASRSLQLQFKNKLSLPIFTGTRIEGEDCSLVTIALVDALTGQVVTSGPESSLKVEIVVLEGDFEGGEEENSTYEDFKNNVVREREGKRSLLTGDVFLDLNEGSAVIGELSFTDNSSWTRSRKFRLGARVTDGYFHGMRVREAKTEPFMVKDHRGELYKKHHPPSLWDEVWRLEKIGKDGAFHKRLSSENINTVKDFLTLFCTDAARLRNILGNGMSTKMWEVTVEHARTCMLTDQLHIYYPDRQRKTGVVFNVVGEVMGVLSDQQFISVKDLSDNEKAEAHALVKLALGHWNEVITCDTGSVLGSSSHAPPNSFPSISQSLPDNIFSNFPSPVRADSFGYNLGSPDIFSIGVTRALDAFSLQAVSSSEPRYESASHSFIGRDAYKDARELEKLSDPLMYECGRQTFFNEDSLQYMDSGTSLLSQGLGTDSPADLGTAVTSFLAMSAQTAAVAQGKASSVWRTLVYVLKWRFSIKRIVAKRKKIHGKEKFG